RRHVLIAAPTGSGKTLAAFLAAIDELVRTGVTAGALPDQTLVVYVSPLKALSNDIQRNLEAPLAGIRAELAALGLPEIEIRTFVRTGDTPQHERPRRSRSRKWRGSSSARGIFSPTARPTAPSSTRDTPASATSSSRSPPHRSRR